MVLKTVINFRATSSVEPRHVRLAVIVCSCNVISDTDLAEGIATVRRENPHRPVTVGLVYKALGKKLNCGGCLPLTMQLLAELDPQSAERPSRRRRSGATGGAAAGFRAAASPESH